MHPLKVKIEHNFSPWPLHRQVEFAGSLCHFYFDQEDREYDAIVVFEGLDAIRSYRCPSNMTILVTGEPSPVKQYDRAFLNQFSLVVTTQKSIFRDFPSGKVTLENTALPWWSGLDLDRRSERMPIKAVIENRKKSRFASVICSRKAETEGHRRRLQFVDALALRMGPELEVFGRGHRPIADKAEALLDFKVHVAIENCREDDYWTEKLADPILSGCRVLYHGCGNVLDYFPGGSVIPIDIDGGNAVETTITKLESLRNDSEPDLESDRLLLLHSYNLFSRVPEWISRLGKPMGRLVTLHPEPRGWRRLIRKALKL